MRESKQKVTKIVSLVKQMAENLPAESVPLKCFLFKFSKTKKISLKYNFIIIDFISTGLKVYFILGVREEELDWGLHVQGAECPLSISTRF